MAKQYVANAAEFFDPIKISAIVHPPDRLAPVL
jgi:hypothetical protein